MKSSTAYGSENEETSFTRRIAAPDRAVSNRKQKNRIAVAGATIGFIAASAVVGYTALRDGSAGEVTIPIEQLEVSAQAAPASSQFVTPLDDSFYPTLEELDVSPKDGVVTQKEYLNYLETKKDVDIAEINESSLPDDIKEGLIKQMNDNHDTNGPCAMRAMKRIKANGITLTKANTKLLYYSLDTFCPTKAVESPHELVGKYAALAAASTEAPPQQVVVETPTGTTVVEIPLVEQGEPTTTIVLETPSGPEAVEIPVVEHGEPSTTIVVDTPTGPTVIEVPIESDTPVVTPAPDSKWVTKEQFKQQLDSYFEGQTKSLEATAAQVEARAASITMKIKQLGDCIEEATNKFGWYGVYEESPHFDNAVRWVVDVCLLGLE